jgi:hypothetical protein
MSIWTDKKDGFMSARWSGASEYTASSRKMRLRVTPSSLEALLRESLERDKGQHPRQPAHFGSDDAVPCPRQEPALPETAKYHATRAGQWALKYRASQARAFAAHMVTDMLPSYAPATINRTLGTVKKALHMAWERDGPRRTSAGTSSA